MSDRTVDAEDLTGDVAVEGLTHALRGASFRRYREDLDLSETFELHLCADGGVRAFRLERYPGVPLVGQELFGHPWTVSAARLRSDGSYGAAVVTGTFTARSTLQSGGRHEPIADPFEVHLEFLTGDWYLGGQLVAAGTASCGPTL